MGEAEFNDRRTKSSTIIYERSEWIKLKEVRYNINSNNHGKLTITMRH